jgi:hypothetical protein
MNRLPTSRCFTQGSCLVERAILAVAIGLVSVASFVCAASISDIDKLANGLRHAAAATQSSRRAQTACLAPRLQSADLASTNPFIGNNDHGNLFFDGAGVQSST